MAGSVCIQTTWRPCGSWVRRPWLPGRSGTRRWCGRRAGTGMPDTGSPQFWEFSRLYHSHYHCGGICATHTSKVGRRASPPDTWFWRAGPRCLDRGRICFPLKKINLYKMREGVYCLGNPISHVPLIFYFPRRGGAWAQAGSRKRRRLPPAN